MMHDDKREIRKLKKTIKRKGNKRARRQLKQEVEQTPEDAPYSEIDYGQLNSKSMNGLDRPVDGSS